MTSESISGVKCKCGGKLKRSFTEVEFFGIDFGVKRANVCTDCDSEYLPQEVMEEVEMEVRKRGLFGLERRGRVAKSGIRASRRKPRAHFACMKT